MSTSRVPSLPLLRVRSSLAAALFALVAALVAVGVASAHVSVLPPEAPPDTSQVFTVRVPNERPEPTVRMRVEFPAGLTVSRFQPTPGWNREVERDNQRRITAVTWAGGRIGDGEYQDFSFIARTPREPGKIAFKAYQTYQGGETVEWVNPEGQERPAAFVDVKAAAARGSAGAAGVSIEGSDAVRSPAQAGSAPAGSPAEAATAQGGGSDLPLFLALAALVLAFVAVILAVMTFLRRPSTAKTP